MWVTQMNLKGPELLSFPETTWRSTLHRDFPGLLRCFVSQERKICRLSLWMKNMFVNKRRHLSADLKTKEYRSDSTTSHNVPNVAFTLHSIEVKIKGTSYVLIFTWHSLQNANRPWENVCIRIGRSDAVSSQLKTFSFNHHGLQLSCRDQEETLSEWSSWRLT